LGRLTPIELLDFLGGLGGMTFTSRT